MEGELGPVGVKKEGLKKDGNPVKESVEVTLGTVTNVSNTDAEGNKMESENKVFETGVKIGIGVLGVELGVNYSSKEEAKSEAPALDRSKPGILERSPSSDNGRKASSPSPRTIDDERKQKIINYLEN